MSHTDKVRPITLREMRQLVSLRLRDEKIDVKTFAKLAEMYSTLQIWKRRPRSEQSVDDRVLAIERKQRLAHARPKAKA